MNKYKPKDSVFISADTSKIYTVFGYFTNLVILKDSQNRTHFKEESEIEKVPEKFLNRLKELGESHSKNLLFYCETTNHTIPFILLTEIGYNKFLQWEKESDKNFWKEILEEEYN